jgi:Transcriptional regulators
MVEADFEVNADANEFLSLYSELNAQYETYAKSVGLSYSSLSVLRIILEHDGEYTQKTICERAFLPKQTVNAIVTSLLQHEAIKMSESDSDRRQKVIHFTSKGRDFALGAIQRIKKAESKAMESLDKKERSALLAGLKIYKKRLHDYVSESF